MDISISESCFHDRKLLCNATRFDSIRFDSSEVKSKSKSKWKPSQCRGISDADSKQQVVVYDHSDNGDDLESSCSHK